MRRSGRKFSPQFKATGALEATTEQQTLAELSERFEVSAVVLTRWKKEFQENISKTFEKGNESEERSADAEQLYAQIGQLKAENEFVKKA